MANPNRYRISQYSTVDAWDYLKALSVCSEGDWFEGIGHVDSKNERDKLREAARIGLTIATKRKVDRG